MTASYLPGMSRRTTLQWFAAAIAAVGVRQYALAGAHKAIAASLSKGYGTDPDLNHPNLPWVKTMTPHQLQLTAALADLILPGTEDAPAASALGIADFMDEWVSAPYPEHQADRTVIFAGLERLDTEANRHWQHGFLQIDVQHRQQIVDTMIPKSQGLPATDADAFFFRRLRFVVVGAYYTTPEGFKDIGYIGNVPLASYPPVTAKERTILDEELRKLGIDSSQQRKERI